MYRIDLIILFYFEKRIKRGVPDRLDRHHITRWNWRGTALTPSGLIKSESWINGYSLRNDVNSIDFDHFIESQKLHNGHFIRDITWCCCHRCCCCCSKHSIYSMKQMLHFAAYFLHIAILRVDFCCYKIKSQSNKEKKMTTHHLIWNRMWKLLVNIFEVVRIYCFQIKQKFF